MRTIYKYPIAAPPCDPFNLDMPAGAIVRHFASQHGVVTIWAEVDTDAQPPHTPRRYAVYGTGQELVPGAAHVATAICGLFVWHLFELPAADTWHEWAGGDEPPTTGNVQVRLRAGNESEGPAAAWVWTYGKQPNDAGDIVAWRQADA